MLRVQELQQGTAPGGLGGVVRRAPVLDLGPGRREGREPLGLKKAVTVFKEKKKKQNEQ